MAETCLSVRWKDHSNELTALCKIFLEKDHLVDCTLSAEGHSLKVHRMILSACSPYFRTLFSGEKEKNPIVVLFDASFETLKAVIDFVYCGEAKIPQKNLKAFLSLAQLLQIKGPIAFTEKDGNEGVSGVSAGNVSSRLSEDPGGYNEVQGPSANPEDSVEDHSLFFSGGFTDEQSRTHNACSDACENVQLGSVVPPQPGQQINPECDELAIETEISVKSEPLFSGFFETKRELLDNVKNDEPKPGNVPIEMAKESAPVFDQEVLRPSPSGGEFSLAHVESTTQPQLHLLQEQQSESQQQLQQQQHSQLLNENLPGSVAEQPQPLLPVILVPKSEQPDDAVWEESMDSQDVLERDTNEETEPAFGEQNVNQSSIVTRMSGCFNAMDLQTEENLEIMETPPDILEEPRVATFEMLPLKSKDRYEKEYREFCKWRNARRVRTVTENVLLAFFSEISEKYKPSSLWSRYSMLKATCAVYENFDISKCLKLIAYLKRKSVGFQAKKSRSFTREEVLKFLTSAADETFLMMKVAVIMGVYGGCRSGELVKMTVNNIEDKDSILIISLPDTVTNKPRTFTIRGCTSEFNPIKIFRKYLALRPAHVNHDRLFLNFRHGKCNIQPVGVHSFCKIPHKVAEFLKLPSPQSYTGHCFKRTSASLLAGSGGDIFNLKRHDGWKSTNVAEEYIDESIQNKVVTTKRIMFGGMVDYCKPSTSSDTNPLHFAKANQEYEALPSVFSNNF